MFPSQATTASTTNATVNTKALRDTLKELDQLLVARANSFKQLEQGLQAVDLTCLYALEEAQYQSQVETLLQPFAEIALQIKATFGQNEPLLKRIQVCIDRVSANSFCFTCTVN